MDEHERHAFLRFHAQVWMSKPVTVEFGRQAIFGAVEQVGSETRTRTPATVAMRRHQILTSGHSLNRSSRCTAHCQMRAERVYVMHTEMAVAHRAV